MLSLYISLYTCVALVGLIWAIQLVHYPSFHFISHEKFKNYILFHGKRISCVVIPLMLTELGASLVFLFNSNSNFKALEVLSMFFLIAIWVVTFTVSAPIHGKLLKGYNKKLVNKLVMTNWFRTVFWTIRSGILLYIVW